MYLFLVQHEESIREQIIFTEDYQGLLEGIDKIGTIQGI